MFYWWRWGLTTWAVMATLNGTVLANDLRYDWLSGQQQVLLREWIWQARACMSDGVRSRLMAGVRDSNEIVDWVVKPCGGHLQNYLTQGLGRPAEEATAFIRSLAYDELNRVPGVSRTTPEKRPPSEKPLGAAGSADMAKLGLRDANKVLLGCLLPEAQYGQYSSYDGGKSAQLLLTNKCSSQWLAWMDACAKAGDTEDSCIAKSAVMAQLAIKKFGK